MSEVGKQNGKITDWFGLENTVVVLAGADGLIGRACCRALRDSGAKVIGLDLKFENEDQLTLADQLKIDISDGESLSKFFKQIDLSKEKNWAFVNCSYPRTQNWGKLGFENVELKDWKTNVDLHLGSAFHFTQEAVALLKKVGGGSIVNFGSIYGQLGPDLSLYEGTEMKNPVPYAAIKAGIAGLTRYVASVYGNLNIRANVVSPGGIANNQPQSFIATYEKKTPLRRMGTPQDIGGVVAFLVGPSGQYITGQVINVDGGWTAW